MFIGRPEGLREAGLAELPALAGEAWASLEAAGPAGSLAETLKRPARKAEAATAIQSAREWAGFTNLVS
jgi:hypothetical protein